MASQGPNSGGTFANDNSVGEESWINPSWAASDDGVSATCYLSPFGGSSRYLKCTNFGFSIPNGSIIDGIVVDVNCFSEYASAYDLVVRLVKGGIISGTDLANGVVWDDSQTLINTHGGSSELWGLSWTDSDINDSNFGVAISATNLSNKFGANVGIDHVKITVYYTEGGGGGAIAVKSNFMILETDD